MTKYNIVALFGKSGTGKDTLLRWILDSRGSYGYDRNFHKKISCTSRAPRGYEMDGVDYNFISPFEFIEHGDQFIEKENYNGWWYGTRLSDLKPAPAINVGVFNISGIQQILAKAKTHDDNIVINLLPIKIVASDADRLVHQLRREPNPNIKEIFRRYEADERDFAEIPFPHNVVYNSEGKIYETIHSIADLIKAYKRNFI